MIVGGCQTTAVTEKQFTPPKYEGEILPINEPVKIKYRSFPATLFTSKEVNRFKKNGESQTVTKTSYGTYQAKDTNEGLLITIHISKTDVEAGSDKKTQKINASLSAIINNYGYARKIKFNIPEFDADNPQHKQALKFFSPISKKTFPKLPDKGLIAGDELLDLSLELDLGKEKVNIFLRKIVLGPSFYNGREVLVINVTGNMKFFIKALGEQTEMPMQGFSLLDVYTGVHLLSDVTADGTFSMKGKNVKFKIRQVNQVRFPKIANKTIKGAEKTIQMRLESVKRLSNQGLITPEEAAEKRKAILNSL